AQNASNARDFEEVVKSVDDALWHFKIGDVAAVDKVHYTSPKPERVSNPTGQGAGNPMIIPAYVFTPKNLHAKAPLIVLIHGGVPVSDLVARMGYKSQGYRNTFKGFIGKEAVDDPMEYRRRSPYFHAAELQTPLLIHTNTNDEDVNVMEVEHLIDALKAAGKK